MELFIFRKSLTILFTFQLAFLHRVYALTFEQQSNFYLIMQQTKYLFGTFFQEKNRRLRHLLRSIKSSIILHIFLTKYYHERIRLIITFQRIDKRLFSSFFCLFVVFTVFFNITGFICLLAFDTTIFQTIIIWFWCILFIQLVIAYAFLKFLINISLQMNSMKSQLYRCQLVSGKNFRFIYFNLIFVESVNSKRVFCFWFGPFYKITPRNVFQAVLIYGSIFMMLFRSILYS